MATYVILVKTIAGLGPNPASLLTNQGPTLAECANIVPTRFCFESVWWLHNMTAGKYGLPILVFCSAIQLFLILDNAKLIPYTVNRGEKMRWVTVWHCMHLIAKKRIFCGKRNEWLLYAINSYTEMTVEVFLLSLNIILMTDYSKMVFTHSSVTLEAQGWTLGQVIAVSIWVPGFLEWLWLFICTLVRGNRSVSS